MPRAKRRRFDTALLVLIIVALALAGFAGYYFYSSLTEAPTPGATAETSTSARAETPYGESLEISLNTGTETSASWQASYTGSSSQNVYTVNGTYKEQEQVTLSYSLTVTYSNVENIQITNLYIKAVDAADQSSYTYTLASNKALSGASPISDSGSTTRSITDHLTDCQASTTSATIKYYIYCQVQGTGSISGQTLTATISETWFATLDYQQSSESAEASVTPSVTVASWWELATTPEGLAIIALTVMIIVVAVGYHPGKRRRRKGRR